MTNAPSNAAPNTNTAAAGSRSAADAKQIVLKEIGSKWSKFSEQDLKRKKGGYKELIKGSKLSFSSN